MAWNSMDSGFDSELQHMMDKAGGNKKEKIKDSKDEEKKLRATYRICNFQDKMKIMYELKAPEPPRRRYVLRQEDESPRVPLRLVVVIDASLSMNDPYSESDPVSKLDHVKMFTQLLIKSLLPEDYLGIVTFGTTSKVVHPLKKMSSENKTKVREAVKSIDAGGVTNVSSGLFSAIEQFTASFLHSRYFDDNILLFTDGMANEGITKSSEMITEIRKRILTVKTDCQFESDYTMRIMTVGTSGFLPDFIYHISQAFSSDPLYMLQASSQMELSLMKPFIIRQVNKMFNVRVRITALNGVVLDTKETSKEYRFHNNEGKDKSNEKMADFFINDISTDMARHISCTIILPPKHRKLLIDKDVVKLHIRYRDEDLLSRTLDKVISYEQLPKKEKLNKRADIMYYHRENMRLSTQSVIEATARLMKRLDRAAAKATIEKGALDIRILCEQLIDKYGETVTEGLPEYADYHAKNIENCLTFLDDFTVRWDDVWARLMTLASSFGREVPTIAEVYVDGNELYSTSTIHEKMEELCQRLKIIYHSKGLTTDVIDKYLNVIIEIQEKMQEEKML